MASERAVQLQGWIDAAELALAALMATGKTQLVRYGEKEVAYTQADGVQLRLYLRYLRQQLSQECGLRTTRRIIRVIPS